MVNKKMIMLISTLLLGNNVLFSAHNISSIQPIIPVITIKPLDARETAVYQSLVVKFDAKKLTAADNTKENNDVLEKQEAFLSQSAKEQTTKKSSLWPYVLGGSLGSMRSLYFWTSYRFMRDEESFLIPMIFPSFESIDEMLHLPDATVSELIYTVVPLIALYGLYKKYSSLKNQQQELEKVREMRAALKTFGEPIGETIS